MARGINKVIVLGNLGADPDARYMPNGNAVTNISVATTDSWKDKESGERQEKTEWHRVVFFGRLAEIASEYLKKVHKSMWKADCKRENGKIRKEMIVGQLKLLPMRCKCLVSVSHLHQTQIILVLQKKVVLNLHRMILTMIFPFNHY